MDTETADSATANVAMKESDVARRGEKREREEEETEGGGRGEEEGQPAVKRPRAAEESKEPGAALEQQPSYAVNSRSEQSTLKKI